MTDVITIGIDPSLRNTGVVMLGRGSRSTCKTHLIRPNKELSNHQRLGFIAKELREAISPYKGALVIIEGYNYKGMNLAELGEASGVIKLVCTELGCDILVVSPALLKKFATGSTRAEKEDIMKRYKNSNEHIADAMALAELGHIFLTGKTFIRHELEVIMSLRAPKKTALRPKKVVKPDLDTSDISLQKLDQL